MNFKSMHFIAFCCIIGNCCFAQQRVSQQEAFKLFFEKTYLHTDREAYAGGEDIWFKAYLVNAQTNQLIGSSNNLYVELIGPDSKIADRKTIRIDKGLGKGDFRLGDSITPGSYRIRAYTNWMRNFSDYFIFEKTIRIYGEEAKSKGSLITDSRYKKVNARFDEPPLTAAPVTQWALHFFPEGGSMVEGVAGIVAFKASDSLGRSVRMKASIQNSKGEDITEISTASGMGSFLFTALAGESYTAKGTYANGRPFSAALPQAIVKGLSINMRHADSMLYCTIGTNEATLQGMHGKELVLIGKGKGKSRYSAKVPLLGLQATVAIPKSRFPEGIAILTVYDPSGKPQAERLAYIDNAGETTLSITADKPSYPPKGKATLTIKATNGEGRPIQASLSLAVVDAEMTEANQGGIASYLNLQSEVRGYIENPEQYFNPANINRHRQLDLLLLTQGWRDYTWKKLADSTLRISHAPEQGMEISGRVRKVFADKPVTGANITLAAFKARGDKLFSTQTDSNGNFYFDNIQLYGKQLVKLTSRDGKGRKEGILLANAADAPAPAIKPVPKGVQEGEKPMPQLFMERKKQALSDTVVMKEIILKRNSHTRTRLSFDEILVNEKFRKTYKTVINFLLSEVRYVGILPDDPNGITITLGHFYKKPVPGSSDIKEKKMPGIAKFRIKGKHSGALPDGLEDYYYLSLEKVEKIEIEQIAHAEGVDGIIYLTVKPDAFEKDMSMKYFNMEGYYESRTFYAPRYETPGTKPDYRNTIHWEPNISTNEKGEATVAFYNADPKTRVRVVVEGITDKGVPVRAVAGYEVK